MTAYVEGFMFSQDGNEVALILKNRPARLAGKLLGIGGHIEAGERPLAAMTREFLEETGYQTTEIQWWPFATLTNQVPEGGQTIHFFCTRGPVYDLRSVTDERVTVVPWQHVDSTVAAVQLAWLLPMARNITREKAYTFHVREEY